MTKPEISKLKKLLHQLVVIRDKKCLRCGSEKRLSASHIYPKGSHPAMKWMPRNLMCLCYSCHIFWWHKSPIEAGEWFKKEFPSDYKYLKKESLKNDGLRKHLDFKYNERKLQNAIKTYQKTKRSS